MTAMEWKMPNGMSFSCLTGGSLISYFLSFRTRHLLRAFGVQRVLPGDGSPQSTPMPEKPTPPQVGPLSVWITGRDGLGDRRIGGSQFKGWMDLR